MKKTKTERELAGKIGVNRSLVGRKRRQGKTDAQIAEEATKRTGGKPSEAAEVTFAEAQRRKECALARKHELDVLQREGKLLDRDQVKETWARHITRAREVFLGLGSALADTLAIETDPVRVRELIDARVHAALSAMANPQATGGSLDGTGK